ncbi:MAG: hypothetical protein E3J83_01180 [Candidatus Atribacteria bacterium]|nr:MAG: hypothetical protein E3J83_01180 [Candidatus Atribacteria bacterium]
MKNILIRKLIKNWRKIRVSKVKYYYELLLEEFRRFNYPPKGIKKYTINVFKLRRIKKLLIKSNKLHIGCGDIRAEGFINIDVFKTEATDFVCKIEDLPKYIKKDSIKLIYSSHTLEHFSRYNSMQVLRMFYDLLKNSGELRISVPDLIKLGKIAVKRDLEFKNMELIQGILMGGQDTRYNYHKSVFWFDFFKHILINIGFREVNKYPDTTHFLGDIVDASSMAGKPDLGSCISLNIKAVK